MDDASEHEANDDIRYDPSDVAFTECWKDDGYCNVGNLPRTYIIGNQLHYQDYECYEALENSELKDEALRNKAIMEGFIKEDDDESHFRTWLGISIQDRNNEYYGFNWSNLFTLMGNYVEAWTNEFEATEIPIITKDDVRLAAVHVYNFTSSGAPEYLVMLYMYQNRDIKIFAETSLKHLINTITCTLLQPICLQLAPLALEFCKLCHRAALIHDPLYKFCRSSLAMIMRQDNFDGVYYDNMFPYATEEVNNISLDLVLCMEPNNNFGPSLRAVEDFVTFLLPLKAKVEDHVHLKPSSSTFDDPTNKISFLHKNMEEIGSEFQIIEAFPEVSKLYKGGLGNVNASYVHDHGLRCPHAML
ncbi:hypothetical protein Tco_1109727 [Tanacetum coccineum]|uniref:Uncharacterized protein n=1 Tax=Tanacetum coccineum TaxID=301880 RepID=A0ABQ5IH24_9ASTR